MRVVFKNGVIGWDLGGERNGCSGKQRVLPGCTRGTPSQAELRAKQRMERACHGILFAYDYGQKSRPNQGKQAGQAASGRIASRPTTPQSNRKTKSMTTPLRSGSAFAA